MHALATHRANARLDHTRHGIDHFLLGKIDLHVGLFIPPAKHLCKGDDAEHVVTVGVRRKNGADLIGMLSLSKHHVGQGRARVNKIQRTVDLDHGAGAVPLRARRSVARTKEGDFHVWILFSI